MPARKDKIAAASASHNREQDEWHKKAPTSALIERRVRECFEGLLAYVGRATPKQTFLDFEGGIIPLVFRLGRLLVALFLCRRHEGLAVPAHEVRDGRRYQRVQAQGREIATFFGKVRFWRTYMYAEGGGYYPLDEELRMPADGFGLGLVSLMTRLATKMSYAQACLTLKCFLGWAPSQTTLERAVLGLGRATGAWFEQAPPPEDDGDVLVIMVDSKATPTATASELEKRRGKRPPRRGGRSPRHRGRRKRERWAAKRRRKKGDHSKNGRAATLVVMYSLKSACLPGGERRLEGPINRRVYASYAPKRHAFAIARREADRRGFGKGSGKRIQIVVDGDENLERYAKKFFPKATLTLDVIHAVEYLWKAGRSLYREGSKALGEWVAAQKDRLYAGKVEKILRELERALDAIPKTGPGNKGKRERLASALGYLSKRVALMNYKELIDQDLEISSGPVEGAVRYVIAQRFDAAGMRWITERSEALLQLRCIEINGQWDDFIRFLEQRRSGSGARGDPFELLASKPAPLPTLGVREAA